MKKSHIIKMCEQCGKSFETTPARADRRFCSHECYAQSMMNSVIKPCEQCGKPFTVNAAKKETRRFCSKVCSTKNKTYRIAKVCEHCDKPFEVVQAFKDHRFCSAKCFGLHKTTRITKMCEICGKPFETVQSRKDARFCSYDCTMKVQYTKVTLNCIHCGQMFYVKASDVNSRETCSRICQAAIKRMRGNPARRGIPHTKETRQKLAEKTQQYYQENPTKHNWYIDGSYANGQLRRGPSWEQQRKVARERDHHTCQVCGKTKEQEGKNLAVHHIKAYRLFASSLEANALENLLTVCQSCHMKLEHIRT